MRKKLALAAVGLGAAYLMRNRESRDKLSKQFDEFTDTPMRGDKHKASEQPSNKKGILNN